MTISVDYTSLGISVYGLVKELPGQWLPKSSSSVSSIGAVQLPSHPLMYPKLLAGLFVTVQDLLLKSSLGYFLISAISYDDNDGHCLPHIIVFEQDAFYYDVKYQLLITEKDL